MPSPTNVPTDSTATRSRESLEDSLLLCQQVLDRLHDSARLVQARVAWSRQLIHENRLLIESIASSCGHVFSTSIKGDTNPHRGSARM